MTTTTPRAVSDIKAGDTVVWPYYEHPLVTVTGVQSLDNGVAVVHCDRFAMPHVSLPTRTMEVPA